MKNLIVKLLAIFNAPATKMNIAIIEAIIVAEDIFGITRESLIKNLLLNTSEEFTRDKIKGALQSLNGKEIIKWEVIKGTAWVNLTPVARIEYLRLKFGDRATEFINESKSALEDLSGVLIKEGSKLKRKTLKCAAKTLSSLADKLREKSKK